MAFVFSRRLAIPLWGIAFLIVTLTASPPDRLFLMPPTTLLITAVVGVALIVFTMSSAIPWFRTSRSLVRIVPARHRERANAAITMPVVLRLDEPGPRTTDDALDSARMDDDGGSHQ